MILIDEPLDSETKARERPRDHKDELRLWLRLLTCSTLIETEIRRRLRETFDVTLPRFDLMAQLHKAKRGVTLSALSQRMMVTNGNLTALVERLVDAGLVERRTASTDKRLVLVRLTPAGEADFEAMAAAHERWIADFFADLAPDETTMLLNSLAKLKASVRASVSSDAGAEADA